MNNAITLSLSAIIADFCNQPRIEGLDEAYVREIEPIVELTPPVAVFEDETTGRFMLLDGFHRYAACQNRGLASIQAIVLDPPPDGDWRGLAFARLASHGRPAQNADRRAEGERLLRLFPFLSDREIARRVGMTQPTIARIREDLESKQQIASTNQRVGADGKTYTVVRQEPKRAVGELPPESEPLLDRLFRSDEQRAQRKLARYLQRLSIALDDGFDFENWGTADEAAAACRAVFDQEQLDALAATLGAASANVADVAVELGYVPNGEDG